MRKYGFWIAGIVIILVGVLIIFSKEDEVKTVTINEIVAPTSEVTEETTTSDPSMSPDDDKLAITDLSAKYKELGLIDAYNHDASGMKYLGMLGTWKDKGVQQVVMFGDVSEPSAIKPEQFIPVMKKFPDRFMLSTDSGYGIGSEEKAIDAMYQMLDLLDDPELARKIAHDNLNAIIQAQPATDTQLKLIQKLEQKNRKDLSYRGTVQSCSWTNISGNPLDVILRIKIAIGRSNEALCIVLFFYISVR